MSANRPTSPSTTARLALIAALVWPLGGPTSAFAAVPGDERTVIVELFTSQGCSSCPPADRLLTRLGNGGGPEGVRVVPLSFHVDYWNYIGWTDPFSSAEWSERQRRYAAAFGLDTVYTPQLVIQGAAQVVGSSESAVRREIECAAAHPAALSLRLTARPAEESSQTLEVILEARADGALPGGELDAMVALFEEELVTPVGRGENARRTLRNDFVVRTLERAFAFRPRAGETVRGSVRIAIEPGWDSERLGLAAFVQDPESGRILVSSSRSVR